MLHGRGEVLPPDASAALDDFTARGCLAPGEEAVRLGTLPLLRLIGHFRHTECNLGYTHDTNRFSPKHH